MLLFNFILGYFMGWCFHQIALKEVKKKIERKEDRRLRFLSELFCGLAMIIMYNRFSNKMIHFYFFSYYLAGYIY